MKKIWKLAISAALTIMCIAGLTACGDTNVTAVNEVNSTNTNTNETSSNANTSASAVNTNTDTSDEYLSGIHHAEIEVADYGTIYVELDADTAPITVTNFVNLANDGFYDGLTFMRIMSGFMIQGGDPNKDCTGGASNTIKGEFASNGVQNNISHKRGTISMARGGSKDSASSQFFICNADAEFLDGDYAAFGTVTDGMDIVDAITNDYAAMGDSNGVIRNIEIQPVITTIKIVD